MNQKISSSGKSVAFFDVDNTITRGSTLYFLGRGMYHRGYFSKKDIASFVLTNLKFRLTGSENPDEIAKVQEAACAFIKGHKVAELEAFGEEIYDEYVSPALWQGTIDIAREHLASGREVWLVTATPESMANLIARKLGFTGALGTRAQTSDGRYTGELIGKLLHREEKATAVRNLSEERGIDLANSYAYSDSHHDIPLLETVGFPHVINPDTLLRIRAIRDHWPIHDFRRGRRINVALGPAVARVAWLATMAIPHRSRRKESK